MHVFLCHASDDKLAVRKLAQRLRDDGFDPWLDEERLLPGQDWDLEIQTAVRASDVIVVCLSTSSVSKVGYVQKELRRVLDVAEFQPEGRVLVIPVRLEVCQVPVRLSHWQYADLFEEGGYERLRAGLQAASEQSSKGGRSSPRIPSVVPLKPEPDRSRFWWAVGGIVVVLAAGLAAAVVYSMSRPRSEPERPATQQPGDAPAGMIFIPGGRFLMGRNGIANASPAHEVSLASYYLDRFPVTAAQYRSVEHDELPMTKVTWDEAFAWCSAQGKRLPTEAEWEYAARGSDGRLYPWGESFIAQASNSKEAGVGHPEAVGSRAMNRSPFDVADLSGNVWQWCTDDYRHYPGGPSAFNIPSGAKVIRGGSWQADARHVTAVTRNLERPATRSAAIGFRCAK